MLTPLLMNASSVDNSPEIVKGVKYIIPKFRTARNGNLEHVETGDQDFRKYAIESQSDGEAKS